jgi:hypothetical protein
MDQKSVSNVSNNSDPSWSGLYRAGGICAFAYVLIALAIPFFLFIENTELSYMTTGKEILGLILSNGTLWWIVLQTTVLVSGFFAIITFVAMFVALRHVDKSNAAIGSVTAIVTHILFIAYYPVMLGLGFIAKNYQLADEAQRKSYESAAEALLAINNAFNPIYESVFAISILFLSIAMLKGVFDRKVAYLGILATISAFVALSLWSVIHIGYFWWWVLFIAWFIAVGWELFKLAPTRANQNT